MGGPELESLVAAPEAQRRNRRIPQQGVDHTVGDELGPAAAGLEHCNGGAIPDAKKPGSMVDADGGARGTILRAVRPTSRCLTHNVVLF